MPINLQELTPCPNLSKRIRELGDDKLFIDWAELGYSQMTKDHSLCDEGECRANDLRPGKYVTKHTRDGCECSFLRIDPAELLAIYSAGSFPVVSVKAHDGLFSLHARPYQPEVQYVAISHAISDGRGNASDAALPICQLSQIDTCVRKVQTTTSLISDLGWFWMDTLCIPSHLMISTKYTEETQASFKQSTEKALGTLVLDSDIQQLSRGFTYRDAFLRIHFSSWSSRMWTLQEAVLTPKVFLQLKDGSTDFNEIIQMHKRGHNESRLPVEPFLIYDSLRNYLSGDFDGQPIRSFGHIATLRRALRHRRTSNELDKRLIIANLLGIEVTSLSEVIFSQVLGANQHSDSESKAFKIDPTTCTNT